MLKVIHGLVTSVRENGWEVSSQTRLKPLWASHHLPGDQPGQEGAYSPRTAPSASPSGPDTPTSHLATLPPAPSFRAFIVYRDSIKHMGSLVPL